MMTSSSAPMCNGHGLSLNLPQSDLWKQKHWNLSACGSLKLPPRVARPQVGIAMMRWPMHLLVLRRANAEVRHTGR